MKILPDSEFTPKGLRHISSSWKFHVDHILSAAVGFFNHKPPVLFWGTMWNSYCAHVKLDACILRMQSSGYLICVTVKFMWMTISIEEEIANWKII